MRFTDEFYNTTRGVRLPVPEPPPACPECGAPLFVDDAAIKFHPTTRRATRRAVTVRAAFCSGCEFVHEF
jgi:hypothetical protein